MAGLEYSLEKLHEKLIEYCKSEYYPMHMPGHKRNAAWNMESYGIDITEIDGFDNLHQAEGIIKEGESRAARVFGSEESHYLINGSTCGILSAISAVYKKGKTLIVARNCHKSVYHALLLNEAKAEYLYPKYDKRFCINGGISPDEVERMIADRGSEICGVLITSPTYDGVVSDIARIVEIAHEKKIPVIVDEAHGAHFAVDGDSPKSAVACGADIVIQSLHKTLPSLTQTAILHVNGALVDRNCLRQYLQIYQTSSPSYVLMASISRCIDWLETEGKKEYAAFHEKLDKFHAMTDNLKHLHILRKRDYFDDKKSESDYAVYDYDESKVLISTVGTKMSGKELSDLLRKEYYVEMEMAAKDYALGIFTAMDTDAGMTRLANALIDIDAALDRDCKETSSKKLQGECENPKENTAQYPRSIRIHTIADALKKEQETVTFDKALERECAEFIYVYPPGIPLLAPGEYVSKEIYSLLGQLQEKGLLTLDTVRVVQR